MIVYQKKIPCAVISCFILFTIYMLYLYGSTLSSAGSDYNRSSSECKFPIMDPSDIINFSQNDSRLLNYLRARHLTPPSKLSYSFSDSRYIPGGDERMARSLQEIFKYMKGGFFVEVGAFDGIGSNTLFLESGYKWSGLLIECHPTLIPELRKANRKAYIADVCISPDETPSVTEIISAKNIFDTYPGSSSLIDSFFKRINTPIEKFNVTIVPLYSLLAAIEVSIVDLIVLDVQGIELKVLKGFPFTSILVKVWVVEHSEHSDKDKKEIIKIMNLNAYKMYEDLGGDYVFVHMSMGV